MASMRSRMAALSAASVKKVRCRRAARTQRCGDLDTDFDFGFVFGRADARRDDHRAVVARELGVGAVDLGLVAIRRRDAALQIVGHPDRGLPPNVEHPHVRVDPRRQMPGPRGLGVDQAARAEHADEELDRRSPRPSCASTSAGVLPGKSTKSFSPARCTCRIDGFSVRAQRR